MTTETVALILRDDDFPWQKIARDELNDCPEKHAACLVEMKQKFAAYQEKHPNFKPQIDDEFLLAFLRTRKFQVKRAFDAFVNYHSIRLVNPEMLMIPGKGPADYRHILQKGILVIPPVRNPSDGSMVCLIFLKKFTFEEQDVSDIINLVYYLSRFVVRSTAFQTLGVRLVIDIEGVSMSFFTTLLRRFYNLKALIVAQGCFPARIKGIHLMNEYYGMLKHVYSMLWPFLTTKIRKRVFLHGSKYEDMHRHISPKILPENAKGSLKNADYGWVEKMLVGAHDDMVRECSTGFQDV